MYLLLPVINKGIESINKTELRLVVMSSLGILVLWKDYKNPKNDLFHMSSGNSMIWFIIYYITGAYIGKYRIDYFGIKKYIYCSICIIIFSFTSYIYFKVLVNDFHIIIGKYDIRIPPEIRPMLNTQYN